MFIVLQRQISRFKHNKDAAEVDFAVEVLSEKDEK